MKIARLAACLLLFATTALAQKEQPLPKDLPPYGPEKPLQAPDVKVSKLHNGLTLWLVPQPGLPKVSFALTVIGGLLTDPHDRPGLSELLSNTINQGTKSRTARQIAEEMQGAGGDVSAFVTRQATRLSASVLSSKASEGLGILADMAENATFPDSEVDLAKRNLTDSLKQREANPGYLASRAMAKVLFGDSPYSVTGATRESVAATTPADLRAEFARRFRPDQAMLVVVGDFEVGKMTSLVREKLGSWKAPSSAPESLPMPPGMEAPHAIYVVPRVGSVQTTLTLAAFGPPRSDADSYAAEVANAIFGGTFGSRLTTNIREDKGYTYTPFSFVQILRSTATIHTQADVRNAVTGATMNEILYELNRMVTTSPSDRELEQAKRYMVGTEALQLQSRDAVAAELANNWVDGLPPEQIGIYGKKISAVTGAEVDAVAQKYFPAARTSIVAVGEEKVIRDALTSFGLPIKTAP